MSILKNLLAAIFSSKKRQDQAPENKEENPVQLEETNADNEQGAKGMSKISLPGQTKVSTLQKRFKDEFGLTLRVYSGRRFAEENETIGQVRKKKGATFIEARRNTKVGNLEDRFMEDFGIKVQIAGSDDSYLCKNELTLAAALEEDQRKLRNNGRKEGRLAQEARSKNDAAGKLKAGEEIGREAPKDDGPAAKDWLPISYFNTLRFGRVGDDDDGDFIDHIAPRANVWTAIAQGRDGVEHLCIQTTEKLYSIADGDVDDLVEKAGNAVRDVAEKLAGGILKSIYERDHDGILDIDEELEDFIFDAEETDDVVLFSPCIFALGSETQETNAFIDLASGEVQTEDGSVISGLQELYGRLDEDECWVIGVTEEQS